MVMEDCWDDIEDVGDHEMRSLVNKHHKTGYREGYAAGQEFILQSAFNEGFAKSAVHYSNVAKQRGALTALFLFLGRLNGIPKHVLEIIEKLLEDIENIEVTTELESFGKKEEIANIQPLNLLPRSELSTNAIDDVASMFQDLSAKVEIVETLPNTELEHNNMRLNLHTNDSFVGNNDIDMSNSVSTNVSDRNGCCRDDQLSNCPCNESSLITSSSTGDWSNRDRSACCKSNQLFQTEACNSNTREKDKLYKGINNQPLLSVTDRIHLVLDEIPDKNLSEELKNIYRTFQNR